jgi:adenylyltransferase/sulfurtransferase
VSISYPRFRLNRTVLSEAPPSVQSPWNNPRCLRCTRNSTWVICVPSARPVSADSVNDDEIGMMMTRAYARRCLFQECPEVATCRSCSDAGVLGPVPGIIGTLQALEAIKILSGVGDVLSQKLLLFDALSTRFTTVKLRSSRVGCAACSPDAELRACGGPAGYDYDAFTSGQAMAELPGAALTALRSEYRLSPAAFRHEWGKCALGCEPAVLLDVRPHVQFAAARLRGAVNATARPVFAGGGGPWWGGDGASV